MFEAFLGECYQIKAKALEWREEQALVFQHKLASKGNPCRASDFCKRAEVRGLSREDDGERTGVQCPWKDGLESEAQAQAAVAAAARVLMGEKNLTGRFNQTIKTICSNAESVWTQRNSAGSRSV